ncbi:MAG TPA: hypothetical protein VGP80_14585 [Gemmatimonadales bacterium]|jgi:hypothetical protein|nr:hypothetical protein [Gemmatimonadales bacterium]
MFIQRRFLTEFQFDLTPFDVRVREKGLTYSKSYRVSYDNVTSEPVEVTISSRPRLILTVILALLAVIVAAAALLGDDVEAGAWLFYGGFAIVAACWYVASRQSFYVFKAGEPPLVLMKSRPSAAAVAVFLTALHEHRRNYLRQRYLLNAPSRDAADTIHKLLWLHQQGAISALEYETLKARAVGVSEEPPFPPSTLH